MKIKLLVKRRPHPLKWIQRSPLVVSQRKKQAAVAQERQRVAERAIRTEGALSGESDLGSVQQGSALGGIRNRHPYWFWWLQLAFGLVCLALATDIALRFCMRQFGSYDLSPLVDLTWRLKRHEIPGKHFINTFPPGLVVAAKLAALLGGNWRSLTLVNGLIASCTFALVHLQGSPKPTIRLTLPLATILSIPLIYSNHVWHSSVSQYLAIPFVFAICHLLEGGHRARYLWLFLCSALLAGAKQNVFPMMLAAALICAPLAGWRRMLGICLTTLTGAATGVGLYAWFFRLKFHHLRYLYLATTTRGDWEQLPFGPIWAIPSTHLLVLPGLVALALMLWGVFSHSALRRSTRAYLLLVVGVNVLPILSDWDAKLHDLPVLLFCGWLLVSAPLSSGSDLARRWLIPSYATVLLWVFSLALHFGSERERMQNVGEFFGLPESEHISKGYFAGMSCGGQFLSITDELHRLRKSVKKKRVFFGPRMEFGYAALKLNSPRGLPLWWHEGTSYSPKDHKRVVKAFWQNDFEVLVFTGGDRTRMPEEILSELGQRYRQDPAYGALAVYRKRRRRPAPPPVPESTSLAPSPTAAVEDKSPASGSSAAPSPPSPSAVSRSNTP